MHLDALTMQYRFHVGRGSRRSRGAWTGQSWPRPTGRHKPPLREVNSPGSREMVTREFGQTATVGAGGTPRSKLAIRGSFFSQSRFGGIPSRQLAKKEAMAGQRHDEQWSSRQHHGYDRLTLLLRQRGRVTVGASNGSTQAKAHFGVFYGLGAAAFSQKTHKPNQAQLRPRQTSTHCQTCREHESCRRVSRFQDSTATSSRRGPR